MIHKKLPKKAAALIKKEFKSIHFSLSELEQFSTNNELFHKQIFIKARHGNFGGDSRILSIGAKFILNTKELKFPINTNNFLSGLSPKLLIGYRCNEGIGDLVLEHDKIKINRQKQFINFDYMVSENPGFPSYIGIPDKKDFKEVVRALRKCYRAAGFRQKGILL